MKRRTRHKLATAARFTLLGLWFLIVAFPMYWIFATSFKPDHEWFAWPPVYWSGTPTLDNYRTVWTSYTAALATQMAESMQKPWEALGNSLIISLTATTLSVTFGTLLAYGVSRYQILSEKRMFNLLMLRMIPPIVVAAPLTLYYSTLHLLDTVTGLVIVYVITTLPYAVWMTKSFVDEVPREMEQAAELLGASRWRTVWEVIFPLVRSGVLATFLFILILTWSEYLMALILSKTDVVTLPVQLSKYEGTTEGRVYGRQAALAVGVTLPLIIIGCSIRKHLVRGFSFGMVKR
ncbi:carbohydrate ABC transporter permease [Candidatus Entotheonella palauensis]|uniref:carbohydrate ABC transporter permease n=1 Tax=Candidatus Entotheonella palauensis TaxID=93172 RepID=UPI000B7D4464|nr:carbohydrate ABC transporter permease [Candidatus Entotheonella palauensis]